MSCGASGPLPPFRPTSHCVNTPRPAGAGSGVRGGSPGDGWPWAGSGLPRSHEGSPAGPRVPAIRHSGQNAQEPDDPTSFLGIVFVISSRWGFPVRGGGDGGAGVVRRGVRACPVRGGDPLRPERVLHAGGERRRVRPYGEARLRHVGREVEQPHLLPLREGAEARGDGLHVEAEPRARRRPDAAADADVALQRDDQRPRGEGDLVDLEELAAPRAHGDLPLPDHEGAHPVAELPEAVPRPGVGVVHGARYGFGSGPVIAFLGLL
eukprot:gene5095-biopygen7877